MRANQPDADRRIDLVINEKVKVASFALAPKRDLIRKLKDAGVVVMPSIGAKRHAEKVAEWGVDAVLVQGGEGGGHTGQVATSLLVPQVVDAVDIPVIAAGGYHSGRGLVAALAYGAVGVAMGTRFLLTSDSTVADNVKQVYLSKTVTDSVVTTEVDGVPQRLLKAGAIEKLLDTTVVRRYSRAARNAFAFKRLSGTSWPDMIREGVAMKRTHELRWRQVFMAANAPMLYRAALQQGRADIGIMATGQVVGLIDDLPSCEELISRIMTEADEVLKRLADTP
jgi:NAD(P)H-dependent flavin oxidoreductase YrpB (nitropropane dioxygenase family)